MTKNMQNYKVGKEIMKRSPMLVVHIDYRVLYSIYAIKAMHCTDNKHDSYIL